MMLNQNVNLAGLQLTPEEQARISQTAQVAGATPMDAGSYKGYENPVSTGEALSKVLQSYIGAKQKDDILNQAIGGTNTSVGSTNPTGDALSAITGSQINKPKASMDWLKNLFPGS